MAYSILGLQKAIYDRLTGQSSVTSLLAGGANSVYDYVKQDSAFPYIVIGEFTGALDGSVTKTGQEVLASIHVFTEGRGRKQAQTIMKAVVEALDRQESSLTASGFSIILCNFEFSDITIDQEDTTNFYCHGIVGFRFRIWEA